ncbi:unnamed protein product [Citrullus colocynthis]|uniref:Uncharacterized protein n=1 Tax=Citrullus colocynthis TaxID=252529 RepID=A0ABP0YCI2_9ROSI
MVDASEAPCCHLASPLRCQCFVKPPFSLSFPIFLSPSLLFISFFFSSGTLFCPDSSIFYPDCWLRWYAATI